MSRDGDIALKIAGKTNDVISWGVTMCPAEPTVPPSRAAPPTADADASVPLGTVLRVTDGLRRVFGSPAYKPPMLPSAALEIHQLSCNPDVDTTKLIALLERDPMLAGQVLKVANSPLFRGRDAETSLRSAVLRLGLKNLGEVVFELALHMRVFRSAQYSEAMEDLRCHSTACANVSRLLATLAGQDPENAFLCGLLHDIGTAAILIVLGENRKTEPALEGSVLDEVVRQTHEDISGMLARLWKLPSDVADVVAHHHGRAAVESAPLLSSVVVVADSLSAKFGFSVDFGVGACDGVDEEATSAACAKLGLDPSAMASVEEQAQKILERVEQSLDHRRADMHTDGESREPITSAPRPVAASSARKSRPGLLARIRQALFHRSAGPSK